MYAEETIEQIRRTTSLEDVVNSYLPLNKLRKGLCPFHSEKTPSLSVHPSKKFWKCFGCGVSGDVFTFIQKIEGITFIEAVELLANESGVSLPKSKKFQGYITRHWKEKKMTLSHLKVSKEIFRQAVLNRYDELLQERKSLPKRIKWDSWNAKVYLREQFIDYQFDRLDERERKVNEGFDEEKRRIQNG